MRTWTLEQVKEVEDLYVKGGIAEDRLAAPEGARQEFAGQMVAAARTFGMEVHPDDVALSLGLMDRATHIVEARGLWAPGWRDGKVEVELAGGEHGGEIRVVTRNLLEHGVIVGTKRYRLAGWREAERRWVMA